MALVLTPASLTPTEGQWWRSCTPKGTERRVKLVASQFGFLLWTASFRHAQTGAPLEQRFFCSAMHDSKPLAVFKTIEERRFWMEKQWDAQQAETV
jgi:hypothetical protein